MYPFRGLVTLLKFEREAGSKYCSYLVHPFTGRVFVGSPANKTMLNQSGSDEILGCDGKLFANDLCFKIPFYKLRFKNHDVTNQTEVSKVLSLSSEQEDLIGSFYNPQHYLLCEKGVDELHIKLSKEILIPHAKKQFKEKGRFSFITLTFPSRMLNFTFNVQTGHFEITPQTIPPLIIPPPITPPTINIPSITSIAIPSNQIIAPPPDFSNTSQSFPSSSSSFSSSTSTTSRPNKRSRSPFSPIPKDVIPILLEDQVNFGRQNEALESAKKKRKLNPSALSPELIAQTVPQPWNTVLSEIGRDLSTWLGNFILLNKFSSKPVPIFFDSSKYVKMDELRKMFKDTDFRVLKIAAAIRKKKNESNVFHIGYSTGYNDSEVILSIRKNCHFPLDCREALKGVNTSALSHIIPFSNGCFVLTVPVEELTVLHLKEKAIRNSMINMYHTLLTYKRGLTKDGLHLAQYGVFVGGPVKRVIILDQEIISARMNKPFFSSSSFSSCSLQFLNRCIPGHVEEGLTPVRRSKRILMKNKK